MAFALIRDKADQIHEAWARAQLSDEQIRESVRTIAGQLRRWEDQTSPEASLFFTGEELFVTGQECPPFNTYDGRFSLLGGRIPQGVAISSVSTWCSCSRNKVLGALRRKLS